MQLRTVDLSRVMNLKVLGLLFTRKLWVALLSTLMGILDVGTRVLEAGL